MAAKMSTDFKQPMQQARDYNLASKVENINKISKQWVESISKVMDNQFKVTGDKNVNWQSKPQASYMDKSLQINADTILENVKQVMATMKENASLRELNKKLIMAVAAY